jgi:hypothetical protein
MARRQQQVSGRRRMMLDAEPANAGCSSSLHLSPPHVLRGSMGEATLDADMDARNKSGHDKREGGYRCAPMTSTTVTLGRVPRVHVEARTA